MYVCGLGTIQSNMPPGPLEIKEKTYLTDAPPSDMPTNNVKLYQPRLLHCQYNKHAHVESCYVSAAATYTPAGRVLLSPTPLLFKHAYWLSAAVRWMLAGLWQLLLIFCHSILHVCWRCVSLSAIPADMVSHYLCFTIGQAFWFVTLLSAMHVGVVPHYRPYLLVGASL